MDAVKAETRYGGIVDIEGRVAHKRLSQVLCSAEFQGQVRRRLSGYCRLLIFILFYFFWIEASFAGPELAWRDITVDPLTFGVRMMSMGAAAAAVENPAVLPFAERCVSISYGYSDYQSDREEDCELHLGSVTVVSPVFWGRSAVGLRYFGSRSNHFSLEAPLGTPLGTKAIGDATDEGVYFIFGKEIFHNFYFGVLYPLYLKTDFNIKLEIPTGTGTLVRRQSYSAKFKIGRGAWVATYRPLPYFAVGAKFLQKWDDEKLKGVKNASTVVKRDEYRLGMALFPDKRTTIALDFEYVDIRAHLDEDSEWDLWRYFLGIERWFTQSFAVRMGSYDDSFTMGMGVKWMRYVLDYCYIRNNSRRELGDVFGDTSDFHYLSITRRY